MTRHSEVLLNINVSEMSLNRIKRIEVYTLETLS